MPSKSHDTRAVSCNEMASSLGQFHLLLFKMIEVSNKNVQVHCGMSSMLAGNTVPLPSRTYSGPSECLWGSQF